MSMSKPKLLKDPKRILGPAGCNHNATCIFLHRSLVVRFPFVLPVVQQLLPLVQPQLRPPYHGDISRISLSLPRLSTVH